MKSWESQAKILRCSRGSAIFYLGQCPPREPSHQAGQSQGHWWEATCDFVAYSQAYKGVHPVKPSDDCSQTGIRLSHVYTPKAEPPTDIQSPEPQQMRVKSCLSHWLGEWCRIPREIARAPQDPVKWTGVPVVHTSGSSCDQVLAKYSIGGLNKLGM